MSPLVVQVMAGATMVALVVLQVMAGATMVELEMTRGGVADLLEVSSER